MKSLNPKLCFFFLQYITLNVHFLLKNPEGSFIGLIFILWNLNSCNHRCFFLPSTSVITEWMRLTLTSTCGRASRYWTVLVTQSRCAAFRLEMWTFKDASHACCFCVCISFSRVHRTVLRLVTSVEIELEQKSQMCSFLRFFFKFSKWVHIAVIYIELKPS